METVICDSKLSQLPFSTISAHSANAQPFQKRKRPPLEEEKGQSPENLAGPEMGVDIFYAKLCLSEGHFSL